MQRIFLFGLMSFAILACSSKDLYNKVLACYEKKEYEKGSRLLGKDPSRWGFFLQEPEGCELLVSILAEARSFEALEVAARSCLKHKKALGVSAEGLSYAFSAMQRPQDAARALEEFGTKALDDRGRMALVRVYLEPSGSQKALDQVAQLHHGVDARLRAKALVLELASSSLGDLWLKASLRYPQLSKDPELLALQEAREKAWREAAAKSSSTEKKSIQ